MNVFDYNLAIKLRTAAPRTGSGEAKRLESGFVIEFEVRIVRLKLLHPTRCVRCELRLQAGLEWEADHHGHAAFEANQQQAQPDLR